MTDIADRYTPQEILHVRDEVSKTMYPAIVTRYLSEAEALISAGYIDIEQVLTQVPLSEPGFQRTPL